MTLEDLAAYRPFWTEPLQASYGGYQVALLGLPNTGGFTTLGGLQVIEAAGLKQLGHYAASAEALYGLIEIERATQAFVNMTPSARRKAFSRSGALARIVVNQGHRRTHLVRHSEQDDAATCRRS